MAKISKKSDGKTLLKRVVLGLIAVAVVVIGGFLLLQGKDIAVLNPKGVIGEQQKQLIIFTTLLGMTVVIPVFIMIFAFAWRYREGNTKAKYTPEVEGNHVLEFIWWAIPITIISVLGVLAWQTSHSLDPYKSLQSDKEPLKVQVVSLQWKWLFIYPAQGIATVNDLHIPIDRPIEFEITADSPMNGFWIPKLGSQVYAMNGMTSKLSLLADEAGVYKGQSSNISGVGYADMSFDVTATKQQEFDSWSSSILTKDNQDTIDWTTYQELAKPSIEAGPRSYVLHESNLFNLVVGKYMSMSDNQSDGMSHDMMEHMQKHGEAE